MKTEKSQKQIENRAKWKFLSLDNSILASKEKAFNVLVNGQMTTQEFILASGFPRKKAMSILSTLELDKRIERKNGKWFCK